MYFEGGFKGVNSSGVPIWDGPGKMTCPLGYVLEGTYVNSLEHGLFTSTSPDGK